MQNSQETAIFQMPRFAGNFREALLLEIPENPTRQNKSIWKALFLSIIFTCSLVAFPWQGSKQDVILTESNFLAIVNQDRSKEGLTPLRQNQQLQMAATAKAQNMLNKGYFSHNSPDGTTPWDFIKSAGFSYQYAGENLAINYTNPNELLADFLRSPSHRDNLLSPLFTETGVAVVTGEFQGHPAVVTVQMFAAPKTMPLAAK